jgi:uncharacterized protein
MCVIGAMGGGAAAASFNCKKAKSKVEKLICATPELSKADDELGKLFKEAMAAFSDAHGDGKALRAAQAAWLKRYRNLCGDAACMLAAYERRNAELRAIAKPSGRTGVYDQASGSVSTLEIAPGRLRFELFSSVGEGERLHIGQLCGEVTLDKNGAGRYVDEELECELRLSFPKEGKLKLTQEGSCGFGAGVVASGTYERGGKAAPALDTCYVEGMWPDN